jgi:2-polyprenyl-3-methyl-5-hydroxy-6-metoxy-1,4-benzoquinol methylase
MVTVDFSELNLTPGCAVLDAGCGTGRHLRALAKLPGLTIVGIDRNEKDTEKALQSLLQMPDALSRDYRVLTADISALPFDDGTFECVICSEVLEHIADHEKALGEVVRVLKPRGRLVVSVPRYFSERICWLISSDYYNEKGGHVRIYTKKEMRAMLDRQGVTCWKINYKHALHAPYWWLKCLVGLKNETHVLVKLYKRFLEWDIMRKPRAVRIVEDLLNPLIGKSVVYYLKKG